MERPETRYAKTNDGLSIAYQVFGSGPFDLVYTPGWISNVDAAWELPGYCAFLGALSGISRDIVFDRRGSGLFTDIVGSTERACHSVMLRGRTSLNDRRRTDDAGAISGHGDRYGRRRVLRDVRGARAIQCAQTMVGALEAMNIRIRSGIHTGEAETIDGKVGGLALVMGARVAAMAASSHVLVSRQ